MGCGASKDHDGPATAARVDSGKSKGSMSAREEVKAHAMKGEVGSMSKKRTNSATSGAPKKEIEPPPAPEPTVAADGPKLSELSEKEYVDITDGIFALWDLEGKNTIDLIHMIDTLLEVRDDVTLDEAPDVQVVDRTGFVAFLKKSFAGTDAKAEASKLLTTVRCFVAGKYHDFKNVDAAINELYAISDEDGGGDIDREEFKAAMRRAGIRFAAVLFNHDDADGNGVLDKEEFGTAIQTLVDDADDGLEAMARMVEAMRPIPTQDEEHVASLQMANVLAQTLSVKLSSKAAAAEVAAAEATSAGGAEETEAAGAPAENAEANAVEEAAPADAEPAPAEDTPAPAPADDAAPACTDDAAPAEQAES